MIKLPVYFLSDNHFKMDINEREVKRRKKIFYVFEKIKLTGGTLIIGGDFFDFWFDYGHVIPPGYTNLLEKLSELNKLGIIIHYVLGNHDFWDFGYFKNKFGAHVHYGNLECQIKNNNILISHGDGLLKNDYSYRFMKKIIRSKMFICCFKNFNSNWGCSLAKKISKTSEDYHHHDEKSNEIREELLNYAFSQWNLGFETVIIGHYHQTGIIEKEHKRLIFMGDWLKHFTVTRFDDNGWWQGEWDEI